MRNGMLVCPIEGKELQSMAFDTFTDKNGCEHIKTGVLYTDRYCYPVINGVPIMLVFSTPLTQKFAEEHAAELRKLPAGVSLPDREPMKGEKSVQETFTEEWGGLGDDEIVFAYDEEEGYRLHKDVWLQMSDEERAAKETVLDVGCGFGKEARYMARIFERATVYAVDLNLAVVSAGISLLETGRIVPVVASLYHLPFADAGFDHVHCQGVLHHTYSTEAGFKAIEKKVNERGSIFIWVYAWEDSFGIPGFRGFLVHTYYFVSHRIFRPVLSRAPSWFRNAVVHLISVLYHPLVRNRGSNRGRWKYSNTVHGIRDMFTPMYAHRHRFNEVLLWFQEAGYLHPQIQSALEYQKLFHRRIIGIGFVGRKYEKC